MSCPSHLELQGQKGETQEQIVYTQRGRQEVQSVTHKGVRECAIW